MKILSKTGRDDIATVYAAEINGKKIEFVESVQPPVPRSKKWVLIISSLCGCPVKCRFCDAGGSYQGILTKEELFAQIDFLIKNRFGSNVVPVEKFKIQFARVGEPAFNKNVLDALEELPVRYNAAGLTPSISTIAPIGTEAFFERLLDIKKRLYKDRFQMQFSIHTTDVETRDWLIPVKKWDFKKIAEYGERFYEKGDRKITLNFALAKDTALDSGVLLEYFNPEKFLVKITPVNPTYTALKNNISSYITPEKQTRDIIELLQNAGYDVILSIGELEENNIGSNCGQYISNVSKETEELKNSYTYKSEIF